MIGWWAVTLLAALGVSGVQGDDYKYFYLESKEHIGSMVHLMEWSYLDIKNECEFLWEVGYNGILISPPVEHVLLDKPSWQERYMPISLKLETRSGTLEDLKDMLYHCAKTNGLRVYADINLNNMLKSTTKGEVKGMAGSVATPSQYKYEGITKDEFHKSCKLTKADYKDATKLRECEVDNLQDLDNGSETLQEKHLALLNQLIEMGVSGFRIMMAKHMYPQDLKILYLQLGKTKYTINMEKPLMVHDVNDLEESVVKAADYEKIGTSTDYSYAKRVGKYFLKAPGRSMNDLVTIGDLYFNAPLKARETERMVFLYNHLTQKSQDPDLVKPEKDKAFKMAMAFMLSWPYGIPLILSSYKADSVPLNTKGKVKSPRPEGTKLTDSEYTCISEYNCEHRTPATMRMARFNDEVKNQPVSKMKGNKEANWFAFARGELGFIFFNAGEKDKFKKFYLRLQPGEYCDIASGDIEYNECTGKTITIYENGTAPILLKADDPNGYVAIHERSRIIPHIKAFKKWLAKDKENEEWARNAAQGIITGVEAAGRRAKRIKDALQDPNKDGYDLLEATALASAADGAGNVVGNAKNLLSKKLGSGTQTDHGESLVDVSKLRTSSKDADTAR